MLYFVIFTQFKKSLFCKHAEALGPTSTGSRNDDRSPVLSRDDKNAFPIYCRIANLKSLDSTYRRDFEIRIAGSSISVSCFSVVFLFLIFTGVQGWQPSDKTRETLFLSSSLQNAFACGQLALRLEGHSFVQDVAFLFNVAPTFLHCRKQKLVPNFQNWLRAR